uniref:Uncharacterized protein n=1 Tax=Rhizophora mucronata TaxID=61149 RepID=A0A2P2PGB1_RHIMU
MIKLNIMKVELSVV